MRVGKNDETGRYATKDNKRWRHELLKEKGYAKVTSLMGGAVGVTDSQSGFFLRKFARQQTRTSDDRCHGATVGLAQAIDYQPTSKYFDIWISFAVNSQDGRCGEALLSDDAGRIICSLTEGVS